MLFAIINGHDPDGYCMSATSCLTRKDFANDFCCRWLFSCSDENGAHLYILKDVLACCTIENCE